jgi:hypothetical protein
MEWRYDNGYQNGVALTLSLPTVGRIVPLEGIYNIPALYY